MVALKAKTTHAGLMLPLLALGLLCVAFCCYSADNTPLCAAALT